MTSRHAAFVLAIGVAALCLSACANEVDSGTDSVTIDVAKSETQAVENRIVDKLPASVVAEVDQQSQGVLLGCPGDAVMWAGRTTVTVHGSPDVEQVLKEAQSAFADEESYTAAFTVDPLGDPLLEVESAAGGQWLVGPTKGRAVIDISSFSPCFPTPEGMQPSDRY